MKLIHTLFGVGLAVAASSSFAGITIPTVCKTIDLGSSTSITVPAGTTYDAAAKNGCKSGTVVRYLGASGTQSESQKPIFILNGGGATLKNVVIGTSASSGTNTNYQGRGGDGVHCYKGSCTLTNVYWDDVGEDAATFKNNTDSSAVMNISSGAAQLAKDKTFQHNGAGTMKISSFTFYKIGKAYRSCGNCSTQYSRRVEISNSTATGVAKALVGINAKYASPSGLAGDKAVITNVKTDAPVVCQQYIGNNTGKEPPETSGVSGACTIK